MLTATLKSFAHKSTPTWTSTEAYYPKFELGRKRVGPRVPKSQPSRVLWPGN